MNATHPDQEEVVLTSTIKLTGCSNLCPYMGIDGGPGPVSVCHHPDAPDQGYILPGPDRERAFRNHADRIARDHTFPDLCPLKRNQDEAPMSNEDPNRLCVSVENGKYTVKQEQSGRLHALRYGEEWRDLCGDGLVYAMAAEIEQLREKVAAAKNCLVCVGIADPVEVCENTLFILDH